MSLTVRRPQIASRDANVNWSPVPEYSHLSNGASVLIPYVEHYLNNVMTEVRAKHCDGKPDLKEEISEFIKQEAIHARYHLEFNHQMFNAGYDALQPLIDDTVAHLQRMREQRSLAFNVAYCAGFETTATFSAKYVLERCDAFLKGADAYGANLFQWHVAEEFEHRATCHRAFHAVSGSYFIRMAGLIYSFWHINKIFAAAAKIIMAKYRETMTPAEIQHSKRVERRLIIRQMSYLLPRMWRLVNPFYDPEKLPVTENIKKALEFFKSREPLLSSFADMRDTRVFANN
ncbi:MAG: metal-dependent hydrolase [Caulobacterales bacterium]